MAGQALTHGSLFSGIGGFDLAAEWCGWRNIFHCEINEFCNHVLNFYWAEAASIKNIIGYEWEKWKGKIDVLSGGFPCQPYSTAGKQLGKADPRHLWPAMLGAVKAIQPSWVVGENVCGLVGWNGGVVFNEVQADLEAAGYEVLPFLLPAAGVNAPHRRERIWFIAHRIGLGWNKGRRKTNGKQENPAIGTALFGGAGGSVEIANAAQPAGIGCNHGRNHRQERPIQDDQRATEKDQPERQERQCGFGTADLFSADAGSPRLEGQTGERIQGRARRTDDSYDAKPAWFSGIPGWENFPQTQPAVRIGDDGLPDPLDFDAVFEGIPFPVKPISFSKWRTESIKAYGNAIVPQVAFQLFRVIQEMTGSKRKKS